MQKKSLSLLILGSEITLQVINSSLSVGLTVIMLVNQNRL